MKDNFTDNTNLNYHHAVERVLLFILLLNLIVVIGKGFVGLITGSLAVISDALHSTIDAINNIVGIVVIRYASAPPDKEHPYGHGKFETLGAFCIAGFLAITCFEIASRALSRLFASDTPSPQVNILTIGIMIATIIINIFVARYESRRGRELQSELLSADATHTNSDIYVSLSVIIGLFFTKLGYWWLDSFCALIIAFIIAYNGYKLFRETVPILVDAAIIDPKQIEKLALQVPGVAGCYNIRSRGKPGDLFIEMVITVEAKNLAQAHSLTEILEQDLRKYFGSAAITIHFEPHIEKFLNK